MLVKNGKCEKTFDKILKLLKTSPNIKFVKTEDNLGKTLEYVHSDGVVCCTDNGKSTGKIEGLIRKNEIEKIGEN